METAKNQQKYHYDKHKIPTTFKASDSVLLSTHNLQLPGLKKLSPQFVGQWEILVQAGS